MYTDWLLLRDHQGQQSLLRSSGLHDLKELKAVNVTNARTYEGGEGLRNDEGRGSTTWGGWEDRIKGPQGIGEYDGDVGGEKMSFTLSRVMPVNPCCYRPVYMNSFKFMFKV